MYTFAYSIRSMCTEKNKKASLFSALLAGLFLLVAIGAHHGFSQKKLLSYEGDNIEVSIDVDDEGDNSWGLTYDLNFLPGDFIYIEKTTELKSPKIYYSKQTRKSTPENRLYILFHQLRTHLA